MPAASASCVGRRKEEANAAALRHLLFPQRSVAAVLFNRLRQKPEGESDQGRTTRIQEARSASGQNVREEEAEMKKTTESKRGGANRSVGREVIASLKEAIAWAGGEDVPVRVTTVQVPTIDVRAVRRRLGLSQSEFAAKFGFQAATLKNWEQGRTRPDGPARVLLAVIASHPEAVEDALRKGQLRPM
jgi:putative transcriptional regulator